MATTAGPSGPTFSVVTVCFNAASALPGTVASLRAQHWSKREWVVVDGGSSDGTQSFVHASGEPLGAFVSERDRGIYDAMNKAVALARGDIVFFLNADDRFHDPAVLADVAQQFIAYPALDLLYGNVVVERPGSEILKSHRHINGLSLPFEDLCHQAVFARRSLFDRFGLFDLRWPTSADYDWLLRVFNGGARVRFMNRRMAYFMAGGSHAKDPAALAAERRNLRLQYMPAWQLEGGRFASRVMHRLSRSLRGGLWVGESINRG